MIPAKIDNPIPITTIREKSVESIVDWFDLHKQSFYALGWSYLRNQQQMEELFYRSIIKVHKELPRFKKETSFETWVTSIFIHTCRELSDDRSLQASEESEQHKDLFNALDQLKTYEKEALVLTYVKGFSQEEAAHLLQVSVETMKEHLFSGIQSLRKEMGYGSSFHGCKEYHKNYIDYIEKNLDRSKKIDFEVHIYHCQDCQEDLATFQDVMLTMIKFTERINDLLVPLSLMKNVKDRLAEEEKHRQQRNKKRKRIGLIFVSVFALLIGTGYFSGVFTNLYYAYAEKDQELRAFLQHGLGEALNLEAENNGVKIKINGVIADDVQTLVFYEIEDKKGKNQYRLNNDDGVLVKNQYEIMGFDNSPRYFPNDLKSKVNKEEKNVYYGKISLQPLKKGKGTIKLKITKLQKLDSGSPDGNKYRLNGEMEYKTGEWNFEIPVTKQHSSEYALHAKTAVAGIPIQFNKLIIAPTATILQYGISNGPSKKHVNGLFFDHLQVNNKKLKADIYSNTFLYLPQNGNYNNFQIQFTPLFGEKPKEVNVQLASASLSIEDPRTIELDASHKYPETFEYAGSTISIDKVEVGHPARVVISNHEVKNREYDSLQFQITGDSQGETNSMGMNTEGVVVDKNGVEYDRSAPYQGIEQLRYLITVQNIEVHSNNVGEKITPKWLKIDGYNTTKY
ncbi:MAG: sigma-70 family RNA polymerase sigma factor, partial [Bacillota bacterium]|nr:sigma-70 family RNA polymerase sigma factor [Bacillota bacterium]